MSKKDLIKKTVAKEATKRILLYLLLAGSAAWTIREISSSTNRFNELLALHDKVIEDHNNTSKVSKARNDSIQDLNTFIVSQDKVIEERDRNIHNLDLNITNLSSKNDSLKASIENIEIDTTTNPIILVNIINVQDSIINNCETRDSLSNQKFDECELKFQASEFKVDSLSRVAVILTTDRDDWQTQAKANLDIAAELRKAKECRIRLLITSLKCPSRGIMTAIGFGLGLATYKILDKDSPAAPPPEREEKEKDW